VGSGVESKESGKVEKWKSGGSDEVKWKVESGK
jgi:hypothetical protein